MKTFLLLDPSLLYNWLLLSVWAFYKAYGLMAVILGPFRTGYLLMSIFLWVKASCINGNQIVKQYSDKL